MRSGSSADVDCQSIRSMESSASKLTCGGLKIFSISAVFLELLLFVGLQRIYCVFVSQTTFPKVDFLGVPKKAFLWSVDWTIDLRSFSKYILHCTIKIMENYDDV